MFDKEYVFYGKHADIVKKLTSPLTSNIKKKLFENNIDVYVVAPLIGYLYNRKADVEKGADSTTKVFRDKIMDESDSLKYNYRLLMVLLNKDKSQEELTRIAFNLDNDDKARAEYDQLYNQYVLGGVEVLNEKLFEDASDIDEYLMNAYNFMEEFNNRYYEEISEEI